MPALILISVYSAMLSISSQTILSRTYEYYIAQFAEKEGVGDEFYTYPVL